MMPVTRSKPMPVSTCFAGRGEKVRAAEILAAHLLQAVEDWAEDVGLVVRNLCGGEIFETFRALDDAGDALEAHAGVHMLRGQRREGAIGVRVELDEDEVPDFDAAGVTFVDE